jgi:CRP-like cAMP-binding protein
MDDPLHISALLVLGLILKLAGFAVRDELLLRGLVSAGIFCDLLFYLLRSDQVLLSVGANAALVTVNLTLIALILLERTTWRMSAEDRAVFRHFPTLTPGQFRKLLRIHRRDSVAAGVPLTREGAPVDDLMLVLAERITITKDGDSFVIAGPTFVGELALLTRQPSSADVHLPEGGTVLRFPAPAMREMMRASPSLGNAVVALFGDEMARKLADSVPMARAALRRGEREARTDDPNATRALAGAADVVGQGRHR